MASIHVINKIRKVNQMIVKKTELITEKHTNEWCDRTSLVYEHILLIHHKAKTITINRSLLKQIAKFYNDPNLFVDTLTDITFFWCNNQRNIFKWKVKEENKLFRWRCEIYRAETEKEINEAFFKCTKNYKFVIRIRK